jgi:sorbitol/mannitol transport system substrate-binding protein
MGVQFATIPEFQAIGTQVGKGIAGALAGSEKADAVLKSLNEQVQRTMKRAKYIK